MRPGVEPADKVSPEKTDVTTLAGAEPDESQIREEEPESFGQDNIAKENETEKIASLSEMDIDNEPIQAEDSPESKATVAEVKNTEDKAGMDADE